MKNGLMPCICPDRSNFPYILGRLVGFEPTRPRSINHLRAQYIANLRIVYRV